MERSEHRLSRARRIARRFALPVCAAAAVALHVALIFYFERPFLIIFTDEPNSWLDYDTHIEQVWAVTEALDRWGKSWAYDVQLLAGYPNGTIFNADNKGWELWTFALWKLGLSRGMAFNLFILLAHVMVPWIALAAARNFKLGWWPSLLAYTWAMLLWFFDAFPHWCWWVGMIAWAMAGYFALLPLSLMFRYLEDGGWWRAALMALCLAVGHLIHPYTFGILVLPMAALYVRSWRTMGWRRHAGVIGAGLFTIAVNAYWLVVALRFWPHILDSSFYCQSTIVYLLTDYLGLLKEPLVTGVLGNRTGFRFIALVAAAMMLVIWRRSRDRRFLPFVVALASLLALTYLGGYFWLTRQIQPYRHVLPAMFIAVVPAAALAAEVARRGSLRKLPRLAYAVLAIAVLAAVPHLARDVIYFVPALVPEPKELPESRPHISDVLGFGSIGYPKHMEFRHQPTWKDFDEMAAWVERNDDGQGRMLVQWWILGEHLAWRTDAQILGGFLERNLAHSAANFFRRHPDGDVSDEVVERYLTDYAVEYVVLTHSKPAFERKSHLWEAVAWIQPHRIYRVKKPFSYFQQNDGHVRAEMNRLEVTGTDPQVDVVLRFHYLRTFRCTPDCRVLEEPVLNDPVGFVRVPAPHPADFVIENSYRFD